MRVSHLVLFSSSVAWNFLMSASKNIGVHFFQVVVKINSILHTDFYTFLSIKVDVLYSIISA